MFEMPKVSVHIMQSKAKMGGIGEPATAPIAPAVANAVFRADQATPAHPAAARRLTTDEESMNRSGMLTALGTIIALGAFGTLAALAACGHPAPPASSRAGAPNQDALAAFETVRSVLQHPRCQNCHPRSDTPLQGDDGHPHLQNVQRGADGRGMVGERCTTCHGPANPPDSYGSHTPPGILTAGACPSRTSAWYSSVSLRARCASRSRIRRTTAARTWPRCAPISTTRWSVWAWSPGFGRAPVPVSRQAFLDAWTAWASAGAPCPK